jgi:putative transcriptional regulator
MVSGYLRLPSFGRVFWILVTAGSLGLLLWGIPAWVCAADEGNSIFIVANRELADPNFRQTVVLVTHIGEAGPVGVIVNRPTQIPLNRVFPKNKALGARSESVYFGGPVSPFTLIYLFRAATKPPLAVQLFQDVCMSANIDLLEKLLTRPEPTKDLRVYTGYAGWAPGQLEAEIERGDWYVTSTDLETVFSKPPETIWPELIKRASARRVDAPIAPSGVSSISVAAHFVEPDSW